MNRHVSTIVLALAGLLSLAIAARGLLSPSQLGTSLGYGLAGADGLNEVRAQYGGFFLAVALTCGLAISRIVPRQAALLLLVTVFGGVLLGRVVSLFFDGGFSAYGPVIHILFVVDLIGLLAALGGLANERQLTRA